METTNVNLDINLLIVLLALLIAIFSFLRFYFYKTENAKWIVMKNEGKEKVVYLDSILTSVGLWYKRTNDENLYFYIMEKVDRFLYPEKTSTLEYQRKETLDYSVKDVADYLRIIKETKNKSEIKSFLYGLKQFEPYLEKDEVKDLVERMKKSLNL